MRNHFFCIDSCFINKFCDKSESELNKQLTNIHAMDTFYSSDQTKDKFNSFLCSILHQPESVGLVCAAVLKQTDVFICVCVCESVLVFVTSLGLFLVSLPWFLIWWNSIFELGVWCRT